jgi:beta-lactamase superfamily II metal-dependent hydrolase
MSRRKANKDDDEVPASKAAVVVRMYDVGFGDCFLLFIPAAGETSPRKVLVDCGTIKTGSRPMKKVVKSLVDAVRDLDGVPRIDVVIATHRHKDHVSGFADDAWNEVVVKEVWMPWTEKTDDPVATRIREAQAGLALALQSGMTAPGVDADPDVLEMIGNALSNESAMDMLHEGFAAPKALRRFLPIPPPLTGESGNSPRPGPDRTFTTESLPGVTVHVMGPSRDESVISDMDPPAGKSYLQYRSALADGGENSDTAPRPFVRDLEITPTEFEADGRYKGLALREAMRKQIQGLGDVDTEALAATLDSAVNGTSLMLMFKIGRAYMLLPGDAQWGTWKAALDDPEWRALMEKTTFYKVGHHGSHNATPREFVEDVLKDDQPIRGMVSVRPVTKWKSVPRAQLLEAFHAHHHEVVRSDEPDDVPADFTVVSKEYIETRIPIR